MNHESLGRMNQLVMDAKYTPEELHNIRECCTLLREADTSDRIFSKSVPRAKFSTNQRSEPYFLQALLSAERKESNDDDDDIDHAPSPIRSERSSFNQHGTTHSTIAAFSSNAYASRVSNEDYRTQSIMSRGSNYESTGRLKSINRRLEAEEDRQSKGRIRTLQRALSMGAVKKHSLQLLEYHRTVLLEIVRSAYWKDIESGKLTASSFSARYT
jgi:hypothetical protein